MDKLTFDIYIISRCTHNYYARELRKLGLSMGQFPFVMGIAENDGISQEKLSRQLMISKSMTASMVQQLLAAGWITREIHPSDRRNFQLHATEKTFAVIPVIEKIIQHCHTVLTRDLTSVEGEIFRQLLAKIRQRSEHDLPDSPGL